jgi:hypothetical protein
MHIVPRMAWTIPFNLLGIQVSGDLGPFTIYTDQFGRKVPFPRSPPDKPPSTLQTAIRTRFKTAQLNWMNEPKYLKARWEELVNQSNISMTGQNLYISISLTHDYSSLNTLTRQTGITVTPPTPV